MDGQGDATSRTGYNSAGQVTQTRQPKSNGSGSRRLSTAAEDWAVVDG
jgi:hypothetical protein